jgi:hypothetical protein
MMRRTKAEMDAALRFLASERGTTGSAEERAAAAVRVYERIAERLDPLIGTAGVRALFARSMKLNAKEHRCFESRVVDGEPPQVAMAPSARLLGCLRELEPEVASEAAAALFATLFGLLIAFIGERLV